MKVDSGEFYENLSSKSEFGTLLTVKCVGQQYVAYTLLHFRGSNRYAKVP
jgi:hypothetical protein